MCSGNLPWSHIVDGQTILSILIVECMYISCCVQSCMCGYFVLQGQRHSTESQQHGRLTAQHRPCAEPGATLGSARRRRGEYEYNHAY